MISISVSTNELAQTEDLARAAASVLGHDLGKFLPAMTNKDLRFVRCRCCKRSGHYQGSAPQTSLGGSVFTEICEK